MESGALISYMAVPPPLAVLSLLVKLCSVADAMRRWMVGGRWGDIDLTMTKHAVITHNRHDHVCYDQGKLRLADIADEPRGDNA